MMIYVTTTILVEFLLGECVRPQLLPLPILFFGSLPLNQRIFFQATCTIYRMVDFEILLA